MVSKVQVLTHRDQIKVSIFGSIEIVEENWPGTPNKYLHYLQARIQTIALANLEKSF